MTEKISVPVPDLPCDDCMTSAGAAVRHEQSGLICLYCTHACAGAIYFPNGGWWTVYAPIDVATFAEIASKIPGVAALIGARFDRAEP